MAAVTVKKRIAAEPARVFAALADLRGAPGRLQGIKKLEVLTDGPIGKGTRFRETRVMFGREATETMEITAFDPPRAYTVSCENHGCAYLTHIRCTPAGNGTEVEMEFSARPTGLIAKLMAPLAVLMMGSIRTCLEKDLEDIRVHVENGR